MNTNKFSRVIALLISLVMLLGTLPTGAIADTSVIVNNAEYETLYDAAVSGYYNELMACDTYEDMLVIADEIQDEQGFNFLDELTAEQLEYFNSVVEERYEEYLISSRYYITKNYSNVAPFGAPVTGEAASVMLLSAGAQVRDGETTEQDNGIELKKTVTTTPNENGEYILTLEAWVTGERVVTEVKKDVPTDIILVLDQSGSMDDTFYKYTYSEVYNGSNNRLDDDETYYVKDGDTYVAVTYCSRCNAWTRGCSWVYNQHQAAERYTPRTSTNDNNAGHVQFYERSRQSAGTKLASLKTAITTFVNSVNEKAKGTDGQYGTDDDVDHRVAVVGFANADLDGYTEYANTEVFIGRTQYRYNDGAQGQYSNALQDMSTEQGMTNVTNSIGVLDSDGGTYVDLGIEMANGILAANPVPTGETRNRVVIIFTDGAPGYNGSYGNGSYGNQNDASVVANRAMTQVNTTKNTHKATVYTVGIFEGADATSAGSNTGNNATQRANWLMQNLSSNNGTVQTPSYYLSASDSSTLNNIFKQIASNVESGTQTGTLTEESITMDVVSPSFKLPTGASVDDIELYTAAFTGKNANGEYTFSTNQTALSKTNEDGTSRIEIDPTNDTLKVNGFDFAENWVGTETVNNVTTNHGSELIIKLPIVEIPGFLGGNDVPTNDEGSGIYVDDEADTPAEEFVSPDLDIKVKQIKPTIVDQHIYLSNKANPVDMIGVYRSTILREYELNGVKYSVDGVNNEYVDITYDVTAQINGQTVTLATYKIAKGETLVQTIYENTESMLLTENTQLTFTCTVDAGDDNYATANVTAMVYVYKPVLTFEDTEEKYLDDGKDTDYYNVNNFKPDATLWKRADGTLSTADGVGMRGSVPGITLTYDKAVEGVLLTGTQVTAKQDVHVNVENVQLAGDTTGDYAEHTTVVRLVCDCEHQDPAYCKHTDALTAALKDGGNTPEFIVHVYDVYGHLAITKTVVNDTGVTPVVDTFTFTVTLTDAEGGALLDEDGEAMTFDYTITKMVDNVAKPIEDDEIASEGIITSGGTITVKDGYTVTIAELPPETKYTVTETVPVGYTSVMTTVDFGTADVIDAGKTDIVTVTNTYKVGSLVIEKTVSGSEAPTGDKADSFVFTVDIRDAQGNAVAGTFDYSGSISDSITTGTDDEADRQITLTGGQSVTIAGLPEGASYTVTETDHEDYTITVPASGSYVGTISSTSEAFAPFTNTYDYETLTITKKGLEPVDENASTVYLVKCDDGTEFEVVINGNNSVLIKRLKKGIYTVTELTNWSWRYTSSSNRENNQVEVDGIDDTITFTNTREEGSKWLDHENFVENLFNGSSTTSYGT